MSPTPNEKSLSWIEIHGEHLVSNVAAFRSVLDPGCALMIVVKANAYGHGLTEVAPLVAGGADWLGVDTLDEGLGLARLKLDRPVVILGYTPPGRSAEVVRHGFRQVVFRLDVARSLSRAARKAKQEARIHLKVETGTHRLGIPISELEGFLGEIRGMPGLEVEGIYTHFATADEPEHPLMDLQRARFEAALATLHEMGARPRVRHAANSAAILRDARVWYELVRPGLLLYGVVPPPIASTIPLRPAMTLRSRLVAMKGLRPGDSVGYGARFTADRACTIGVVPAGYADGLDPRLAGRGSVLVGGRRAPIVGAVSMDMLTIDVTDVPARTGDEVVLLGVQGEDALARIDVREMAATVGTIPWETLCRVGTRIERIYNSSE